MSVLTSIIIPVYNEGAGVLPTLRAVTEHVCDPFEVLVVHDMLEDTTVPFVTGLGHPAVRPVLNTLGRGPANAIRFGLTAAAGDVGVVTMADASDDVSQIDEMAGLVRKGHVVVAASRYVKGGTQVGGPVLKRTLSRLAGISLFYLAGVGTHDATNSFKAYDLGFVRSVGIDSDAGFEIGIEMVAKARRRRQPVAEIPTSWRDRSRRTSRFRVMAWIPKYLRWWVHAFGPRLPRQPNGDA